MRIGQQIKDERLGTISHSAGIISLAPSTVNIGGIQVDTDALSRNIISDLTMAANTLYMVYAVMLTGAPVLRISANVNSVGPAGFTSWKLVGAFYSNGMSPIAFGSFVNINSADSESNFSQFLANIVGTSSGTLNVGTGGSAEQTMEWARKGQEIIMRYKIKVGTAGTTDVVGGYVLPFPTNIPAFNHVNYDTVGYGDITIVASAGPAARLTGKIFSSGILLDRSDAAILSGGDAILFTNANSMTVFVRARITTWNTNQAIKDL